MNDFIKLYKELQKDEDGDGIAFMELENFLEWISNNEEFTDIDRDKLIEKLR